MTICVGRVASRRNRLAALVLLAGIAGSGLTLGTFGMPVAQAQGRGSDTALLEEIERLRNDLIDLQRFVYGGGGKVSPDAAAAGAGTSDSGAGSLNARLQLRIQQLEGQIRDLTGRVEETSFQMRQLSLRLDKLVSDVDFRLQTLERAVGVGPSTGVVGAAPMGQVQGQVPAQAQMSQPGTTVISSSGATVSASELPVASGGELLPGQRPLAYMRQSELDDPSTADPGAAPTIAPEAMARRTQPAAAPAPSAAPSPGAVSAQPSLASRPAEQAVQILPDGTPEEQYRFAFDLVRKQQFPEAEQALRAFVNAHAEHELAGNAMYWLGETYYAQQRYRDSAAVFVDAYSNYPKGAKASHSLLKLGMSLGALGKSDAACTSFQELRRKFPDAEQRVLRKADTEANKLGCGTG